MLELLNCPVCNSDSFDFFIETTAQMHSNKELFNFDQCSSCKLVFLNPRVPLDLKAIQTRIMPITTFTWSKRTEMAPSNGVKHSAMLTPEKWGILFNKLRTGDTS